MAEYAKLPKIGLTMKTGTITNLIKNVGDQVKKGDVLASFETDKISGDIESPIDGIVLEVLVNAYDEAEVLKPIFLIGNQGETAMNNDKSTELNNSAEQSIPVSVQEDAAEEAIQNQVEITAGGWVRAMPFARDYAKKNSIDLKTVKATSRDGIIRKKDVEAAAGNNSVKATPLAKKVAAENDVDLSGISGTGNRGKIVQADVLKEVPALEVAEAPAEIKISAAIGSRKKLSGMRKAIAERLSFSKQTIPHTYFKAEIDASALLELKNTLKEQYSKGNIQKVTLNDILLKAIVITLKKYPIMYAQLDNDEIVYFDDVNLGVAVSVNNGLIVPVIPKANQCSLTELAKKSAELIEKARNGNLTQEEFTGGNFTVSNLGASDIDEFYAIINPPESAILAISAIKEKVVAQDGNIVIRPMMTITLSVDHRLIDGAVAADFMKDLKKHIQNTYLAML